ncbi:sensor histidine kinase NtrY-like [Nitratireductor pacificus]|uniref:histidine kinase n=1 Tax=Nitratireductor pacificus pht-3B TaxID=391937 RepID=K2N273_9HYPH|nr:PAS domain-containing sensor histidine kinase [Nitratireductor pacificus]EKF18368.1 PAS sensor protein [Nitratireductor pacificus pht-3B]
MVSLSESSTIQPLAAASPVRNGRSPSLYLGIGAAVGALVTAVVSFTVLLGLTPLTPDSGTTLLLIAINLGFILLLFGLICAEAFRIYKSRKGRRAASRLHVRIIAMFSLVAAIPAILVAVIASVTLELGLDRWFEIRTKVIIYSSLSIADAYVQQNARSLQVTTESMAVRLDQARTLYNLDRYGFRDFMTRQAALRGLADAELVRADGSVIMSAQMPEDIPLPRPDRAAIGTADNAEIAFNEIGGTNLVTAVYKLQEIPDAYLYTGALLDPDVLKARQIVRTNTDEYRSLEDNRGNTQLAFALLYLVVTLAIVLAAIWTGIAVADRLVRPIRQLIGAAGDVSTGNLDVSVPVRSSDGDVGLLGDTFNKMTQQLKSQRDELIAAKDVIDERRRFTEAVLSGVTAGVIGVDAHGTVAMVNRSAEAMLAIPARNAVAKNLSSVLPHVGRVFEAGRKSGRPVYREQVAFFRAGAERTFNIQITTEEGVNDTDEHSYVVTVDDITDLMQAQRSMAWADVARRIAHEIKNPLTPIQLSAERIRRRFGKVIEQDREIFDQCTDTIIRQVGDIGRMVDEFSAFARMPKPDIQLLDLREPLREASFLVEVARNEIAFERDFSDTPLMGRFDARLIGQAFGNVIKNAAEAIEATEKTHGQNGAIRVVARRDDRFIQVDVIDNGKGLPRENRQRLLEPYMTTREKGTGLGLAIVKKIVEDHGGRLELHDAPADFHRGVGAMIRIILPATRPADAPAQGGTETIKR